MREIKLANGIKMPQLGMGTWQIQDRRIIRELLEAGSTLGYRLVDTAAAYSNEMAIGKAIYQLSIPREEIFLSDKVWNTCRGYKPVQDACKQSLRKLKTDYLDLYLVHWPASPKLYPNWADINADTWRGMEALYDEGLVRAIGVCNFKAHHLDTLAHTASVMPMVNQLEIHPGMTQKETVSYCSMHHICVEASSPLGNGKILAHPILQEIATQKNKSVAQICLRYGIEKNQVLIPKTANPLRLKENKDIFDFSLSEEEVKRIDAIPYCGGIGIDSDEVTEFG